LPDSAQWFSLSMRNGQFVICGTALAILFHAVVRNARLAADGSSMRLVSDAEAGVWRNSTARGHLRRVRFDGSAGGIGRVLNMANRRKWTRPPAAAWTGSDRRRRRGRRFLCRRARKTLGRFRRAAVAVVRRAGVTYAGVAAALGTRLQGAVIVLAVMPTDCAIERLPEHENQIDARTPRNGSFSLG